MNISEIRKSAQFFCITFGNFKYDYYGDCENYRKIFLKYNIICEAQYLLIYELREGKDGFILAIHEEATKAGVTEGRPVANFEFAGLGRAEATKFLIRKISEKPLQNGCDSNDIATLEKNLRMFFYSNKKP